MKNITMYSNESSERTIELPLVEQQKEKFIEKVKVRKPVYFVAPTLFERTKKWKTNRQQPTKECQNRRKS